MLPGSRSSSLPAGVPGIPGDTGVSFGWAVQAVVAASSRLGSQQAAPGPAAARQQGSQESARQRSDPTAQVVPAACRQSSQQADSVAAAMPQQGSQESAWHRSAPATAAADAVRQRAQAAALQRAPAGVQQIAQQGFALPARPPQHPKGERAQNRCRMNYLPKHCKLSAFGSTYHVGRSCFEDGPVRR